MSPRPKRHPSHDVEPEDLPTLDEWIKAARELSRLVRQSLTQRGSVPRAEIKRALVRFERIDQQAME